MENGVKGMARVSPIHGSASRMHRIPHASFGEKGCPAERNTSISSLHLGRDTQTLIVDPYILLTVLTIPQLYPKQHKMETQYKADSLLITLAGWAAT